MLGSIAEAEEVVQDAWLRWHDADRSAIANAEAWLVTTTTRMAIDRLRSAKVQREHYVGFWLPEPRLDQTPPSPEQVLERAEDLSVAFLTLLERLTPEARAAFLMREVFDADYDEVARTIGKSEAACRQLVSRAKAQLREARPRFTVAPEGAARALLNCSMRPVCASRMRCRSSSRSSTGSGACCVSSMGLSNRCNPSRPTVSASCASTFSATRTSCATWRWR